jgi:hypothetical protein
MVDHSRDWLEVSTETRRRRIHTQETMAQHEELLREMQQSLAKSRDALARARETLDRANSSRGSAVYGSAERK